MPYALFDRDRQIDKAFPTEKQAWERQGCRLRS